MEFEYRKLVVYFVPNETWKYWSINSYILLFFFFFFLDWYYLISQPKRSPSSFLERDGTPATSTLVGISFGYTPKSSTTGLVDVIILLLLSPAWTSIFIHNTQQRAPVEDKIEECHSKCFGFGHRTVYGRTTCSRNCKKEEISKKDFKWNSEESPAGFANKKKRKKKGYAGLLSYSRHDCKLGLGGKVRHQWWWSNRRTPSIFFSICELQLRFRLKMSYFRACFELCNLSARNSS